MKPPTATIRQLFLHASAACVLVFLPAFAAGCGAAGETAREESAAAPDTTIALRLRIDSLTMENTFLKKELETLRQDARGTAMRAAELESQIAGRQEERDLPPPPPEQLASTAPPATEPAMPPPPAPATGMKAQPAYEEGLRLFRARNYNAAFTIFQSLVTGGAPGDLADRCHYWSGECAYALKQYQNAIGHFETVLGFPRSTKKDDAQMMIAMCYYSSGNKAKAEIEFQKVIEKYPASPFAKRARARLAEK